MESPIAPAAPAQPAEEAAPTVSAEIAAVNTGSVQAMIDARHARASGKPLPAVEAPAPSESAAPGEPKGVSKRQQQINDYERRIYEQNERIARLEGQIQAPRQTTPPPAAPAPPVAQTPEWKRYAGLPDAPKLAQFDSVEDHTAAMSFFIAKTMYTEQQQQAHSRAEQDDITAAQQQRIDSFVGKLHEARAADPEFVQKLSPRVRDNLKPFEALTPGEASGPINVIGAQVYDSPIAPAVLLHFSQHPDALAALEAIPPSIAMLPPAVRTRAHIQHIIREFGKLEGHLSGGAPANPSPAPARAAAQPSSISTAPPPPPVLTAPGSTGDPKASAIARHDVGALLRLRQQERAGRNA